MQLILSVLDLTQVTLRFISGVGLGVTNTFNPSLPHSDFAGSVRAFLGIPDIRTNETGLFAPLPDSNIASVDLDSSNLLISKQLTGEQTDTAGLLKFDTTQLSGLTDVGFSAFDEDRYSVHFPSGISTAISNSNFRFSAANEITITMNNPQQVTSSPVLLLIQLFRKVKLIVK